MSQPFGQVETATVEAVRLIDAARVIDNRAILQHLNFHIGAGEFVALLGANGAGKSTLLKMLATLTTPTEGEVLLFDQSTRTQTLDVRRRIGLIGHTAMLYRDLSALDNLVFFGKLYGVRNSAERAREMLDWIGLPNRAGDAVKTFSRGMLQRVAIARALMHEPDLLLADEPFAGLDAPSAAMVEQMFTQLHEQGKTIILTTHDLHQGLTLAERVLVLRDGRLVQDAAADLFDSASLLREVAGS